MPGGQPSPVTENGLCRGRSWQAVPHGCAGPVGADEFLSCRTGPSGNRVRSGTKQHSPFESVLAGKRKGEASRVHRCSYTASIAGAPVHFLFSTMATIDDFQKLDIRVGKIVHVDDFPEAKKPAYKLKIDLGKEIGIKASCAQLVANYSKAQLTGTLVLCVVNFPPRKIGPVVSEVLTLGVPDEKGNCVLIQPERDVAVGGRMY